jgi:hypothetical protein
MRRGSLSNGWLLALLAAPCAFAQGAPGDSIKARVALAVARFAEMPPGTPPGPLHLCVAVRGHPPRALLDLSREKIGAQSIEVQVGPPFAACDIIYVHSSFTEWRSLLAAPRAPALTVGDVPGFLAAGGMVELVIESDSVRFDVNLGALRGQRIRLPAQVLKLARQVRQ